MIGIVVLIALIGQITNVCGTLFNNDECIFIGLGIMCVNLLLYIKYLIIDCIHKSKGRGSVSKGE